MDVQALGVDVYIGGCLKWLCGGPGAAFLWVRPGLRGRLAPAADRLDVARATRSPSTRRSTAATTPGGSSTARRTSRPSTRPGRAWRSSAEVGRRGDPGEVAAPDRPLLELADARGFRCTTPRDPDRRGGTVAIDVEHGYEISRSLKALDILCDYRPGAGIRLSPHFYTRDEELDAAVAAIAEILETGAWRAFTAGRSVVT